jgi:DNA-directed RNA polymerase subunit M/transcription elongation factor TFIIS
MFFFYMQANAKDLKMSNLPVCNTINASKRQSVAKFLSKFCKPEIARELEANIHLISTSYDEYIDKSQQIILNIKNNPSLCDNHEDIVKMFDSELSKGTIVEMIEVESASRKKRFEQMLQEKYEMIKDDSVNATMKCRRCGSEELCLEQKQTRSADESMTLYISCNKCNNRWTLK